MNRASDCISFLEIENLFSMFNADGLNPANNLYSLTLGCTATIRY